MGKLSLSSLLQMQKLRFKMTQYPHQAHHKITMCVHASFVAHLCPTLKDPMDLGLPGSSVHGILQARILDCHFPLQGIFLTQGSNLHLLHWQKILHHCATFSPRALKTGLNRHCAQMLAAALFTGVKRWEHPKCHQYLHG